MNVLRALGRSRVSSTVVMRLYKMYILLLFKYSSSTFLATSKTNLQKLQRVQNEGLRISLNLPRYIQIDLLHEYAGVEKVEERITTTNQRLLATMAAKNEHIQMMIQEQHLHAELSPRSPLDVLRSDVT